MRAKEVRRIRRASLLALGSVAFLTVLLGASLTYVELRVQPRPDAVLLATAGAIVAIVALGILVYVLMVRPAIAQLETVFERARGFFSNNPDPIVLYSNDGRIVKVNPAATSLLGLGRASIGTHYSAHLAAGMRTQTAVNFDCALSGETSEFETVYLNAAGERIPVISTLSPVISRKRVINVYGTIKDHRIALEISEAVGRSEQQFRSIFEHTPDAAIATDASGRYQRVNAAMETLSGYAGEELIGETVARVCGREYLPTALSHLERVLRGESREYDSILVRKDGARREVRVRTVPMIIDGVVRGSFSFLKDTTTQRALERRTRMQTERLRELYELAASENDAEIQVRRALEFGARTLGFDRAYVLKVEGASARVEAEYGGFEIPVGEVRPLAQYYGRHVFGSRGTTVIHDADAEDCIADASRATIAWRSYLGTSISVDARPYGVLAFVDRAARESIDVGDRDFAQLLGALVGSAIERAERARRLGRMAFTDGLTGIANRVLLDEFLERALAAAERRGNRVVAHFVDLDGFKKVNDTYGHAAGDEALREVAARLVASIRGGDIVARIGGDEFVVVQTDVTDRESSSALAQRVVDTMREPIALSSGAAVLIGASVGVAVYPDDASNRHDLMRRADEALYRAKSAGKDRVAVV